MSDKEEPEVLEIDFAKLTFGDLEDFEEKVGFEFREIQGKAATEMPLRALIALVWLVKRQDNPDFTYEDARKVRIETLGTFNMKDSGADPTVPPTTATS